MKRYLSILITMIVIVSCTNDSYLGDPDNLTDGGMPILFNGRSGMVTRALEHADAAEVLGNNFIVTSYKTLPTTTQPVFDHYNVNYTDASDNSSVTNTAGWEYVRQDHRIKGLGTAIGSLADDIEQSSKYWDYAASQYDFIAFSLGKGVTAGLPATTTYAAPTAVDLEHLTTAAYTLTGSVEQLTKAYIADQKTVERANFGNEVKFDFRSLASKIRIGLYETIPGYSVKDVIFYTADGTPLDPAVNIPTLYGTNAVYPTGDGTVTVYFDGNKKAHTSFAQTAGDMSTYVSTNALVLTTKERNEVTSGNKFLGRSSYTASLPAEYTIVLPYEAGNDLKLKVDYTLESRDASGETINVKGATAEIPEAYTRWLPNYAYTYLFKISDNTNGQTGTVVGLYPITFDAVVTQNNEGVQETITTMTAPSITTYEKGEVVSADDEYEAGNIFVTVAASDGAQELTVGDNCNIYIATIEDGSALGITEATVRNCLESGTEDPTGTWKITDSSDKVLTMVLDNSVITGQLTSIPVEDSPIASAIAVKCAKITATAGTIYVFEYIDNTEIPAEKTYKVIKVAE